MSVSLKPTPVAIQDASTNLNTFKTVKRTHGEHQLSCLEGSIDEAFKFSKDPQERAQYFNSRTLNIRTNHKGKEISVSVFGDGRSEKIKLKVDKHTPRPIDDMQIMRMDRSMKHTNMYVLEQLSHSESPLTRMSILWE